MSAPAAVCLIATWRDGAELLAGAVRSAAPHVAAVVVLDGCYDVPAIPAELSRSSGDELAAARVAGAIVVEPIRPRFAGEVEKRNRLLELAGLLAPAARWALVLDADEELERGELLDELLPVLEDLEAPACPLARFEPDGSAWAAPSRLFRLYPGLRYAGRSYWLEAPGRPRLDLSHAPAPELDGAAELGAPHVRHRWDRRDPWRAVMRARWGAELARRDGH